MNAARLFEELATQTWQRLSHSRSVGLRFAEEGMTDLLLLEIMRNPWRGSTHTMVLVREKTPKHLEKLYGTDWEWFIGNSKAGWRRYALQAKIIDLDTWRYNALNHTVHGTPQIDLLERHAARIRAEPLYVFYNYHSGQELKWHCCKSGSLEQFGCTTSPTSVVRSCIARRGARTFSEIHANPLTLPWRCLVKCPKLGTQALAPAPAPASFWYPDLPKFYLRSRVSPTLEKMREHNRQFWPEGTSPKRLMITTTYESNDG